MAQRVCNLGSKQMFTTECAVQIKIQAMLINRQPRQYCHNCANNILKVFKNMQVDTIVNTLN